MTVCLACLSSCWRAKWRCMFRHGDCFCALRRKTRKRQKQVSQTDYFGRMDAVASGRAPSRAQDGKCIRLAWEEPFARGEEEVTSKIAP
jgi:hypothetical protein